MDKVVIVIAARTEGKEVLGGKMQTKEVKRCQLSVVELLLNNYVSTVTSMV